VQELVDEIWDSECTPEEVCGAFPELLPEVRRRWRQMCAVKAQLDALFPASGPDTEVDWSEVASVDPTEARNRGPKYP
jgi:serine/threonine-protein kinase